MCRSSDFPPYDDGPVLEPPPGPPARVYSRREEICLVGATGRLYVVTRYSIVGTIEYLPARVWCRIEKGETYGTVGSLGRPSGGLRYGLVVSRHGQPMHELVAEAAAVLKIAYPEIERFLQAGG